MRGPAPPYASEGPHALWHISEDSSIERFVPHVSATAELDEPLVWAIDTRHLPLMLGRLSLALARARAATA